MELVNGTEERQAGAEGGEIAEEHREVEAAAQGFREGLGAGDLLAPGAVVSGDGFEAAEAREDGGGGSDAPAGESGKAIGGVSDEGEKVWDGSGRNSELGDYGGFVAKCPGASIELQYAGSADALREVLVRGANQDAVDAGVGCGKAGCGGEGVVGLVLDHGPDSNAEGFERLLEDVELCAEAGIDPLAGFVSGPEIVAEGLDDVIGGDADVGGSVADHAKNRGDDAAGGGDVLAVAVADRRESKEVAEELVGSVDKMDFQGYATPESHYTLCC